jgi:hypothetical protein
MTMCLWRDCEQGSQNKIWQLSFEAEIARGKQYVSYWGLAQSGELPDMVLRPNRSGKRHSCSNLSRRHS